MTMRSFLPQNLNLDDKSILITGGAGSFGQCFVRTVLENYKPRRVIVFSRDEFKQYEMAQTFSQQKYPAMRYLIGDVRDYDRLLLAMKRVDYVIHAAAMKHVPIAEYNPMECIRTNVNGAENVFRAAMEAGVKKVVALSTDKAANPLNLYGVSKLASDKIFIAGNNVAKSTGTCYSVIRYGNVVGSKGSVIPFFQKLIDDGAKTLPITDPDMTRFWITLEQGVNFALSSLEIMRGGEIFIPKIPSMRVVDLAKAMAPDLEHEIIGIRPGEKMHEELVPQAEARNTFWYKDRYVIEPTLAFWTRDSYEKDGAQAVPIDFHYASDNNEEWLSDDALLDLINTTKTS